MIKHLIDRLSKMDLFSEQWNQKRLLGLFIFNLVMMVLILLRSAGYFAPYFPITINFIFFTGFMLSVFLLNAKSSTLFLLALLFWVFAATLRLFNIEVWAERTVIYTYEALVLGLVLMIVEQISKYK